jgi:hypothetical protein
MDPNANLAEQERIIRGMKAKAHPEDRYRLRALRASLCDWLRAGGFEPEWHRFNRASVYFGR